MSRMNRTTTILPPPSDFPVQMPDTKPPPRDTTSWRSLVEMTVETVRPGSPDTDAPKRDH